MGSSEKIFRDPLYNYIAVDRGRDQWLLDLIDTREVQRLRRVHLAGIGPLYIAKFR
jgi:HD superfamily phosphohydrolase